MENTKNFIISTDSCCDLVPSYLKQNNVHYISMPYILDGVVNRPELETDEQFSDFYNIIREGKMPTTSQLNAAEMEEYFEELLKSNQGDLLHVTLSSGLSGTNAAANAAAETVMAKMPGRKIFIADSLSGSLGQGMIVVRAVELRNQGSTAENAHLVLKAETLNLQHWVYIDDLKHLRRGGRISAASAVIGSILHLKPVLSVIDKGMLKIAHKTFGINRAFKQIIDSMKKFWPVKHDDGQKTQVYVAHGDDKTALDKLVGVITKEFDCAITTGYLGPVIGSHTGPGSLAVFFFGQQRIKL